MKVCQARNYSYQQPLVNYTYFYNKAAYTLTYVPTKTKKGDVVDLATTVG